MKIYFIIVDEKGKHHHKHIFIINFIFVIRNVLIIDLVQFVLILSLNNSLKSFYKTVSVLNVFSRVFFFS